MDGGADTGVLARSAVEKIRASTSSQQIVSRASEEAVSPRAADQGVISGAANQAVIAASGNQEVVSCTTSKGGRDFDGPRDHLPIAAGAAVYFEGADRRRLTAQLILVPGGVGAGSDPDFKGTVGVDQIGATVGAQ